MRRHHFNTMLRQMLVILKLSISRRCAASLHLTAEDALQRADITVLHNWCGGGTARAHTRFNPAVLRRSTTFYLSSAPRPDLFLHDPSCSPPKRDLATPARQSEAEDGVRRYLKAGTPLLCSSLSVTGAHRLGQEKDGVTTPCTQIFVLQLCRSLDCCRSWHTTDCTYARVAGDAEAALRALAGAHVVCLSGVERPHCPLPAGFALALPACFPLHSGWFLGRSSLLWLVQFSLWSASILALAPRLGRRCRVPGSARGYASKGACDLSCPFSEYVLC